MSMHKNYGILDNETHMDLNKDSDKGIEVSIDIISS